MNMKNKLMTFALAALSALALTACGGGSGGSPSPVYPGGVMPFASEGLVGQWFFDGDPVLAVYADGRFSSELCNGAITALVPDNQCIGDTCGELMVTCQAPHAGLQVDCSYETFYDEGLRTLSISCGDDLDYTDLSSDPIYSKAKKN